ncbi:MAG: hypothetical protein WCS94_02630 [Verrucomicrobiota bacterium]
MNSDFSKYTGIGHGISFEHISNEWDEEKCQEFCSNLKQKYAEQTKAWTDDLHSEWLTRNYLAVKMILSASVMLTSFEYCREKNVRIVQPYLLYYAALSCCRAVIFTRPDFRLNGVDFYQMNHSKVLNVIGRHIEDAFPISGPGFKSLLFKLRDDREMFSYKFPAQGIARSDMDDQFNSVVELCSLLAENAQLNSECLEASIIKYVVRDFVVKPEIVEKCFLYESESEGFVDHDDYYRTNYMVRKNWHPCNLRMMATEGLVEDYFGSWCSENEDGGPYNPDKDWRIIFPFN